ncbi:MAG: ATP-binding protein [Candidatus Zixiibacteriota bacterium]
MESIGSLAGGVAHDLNNMLGPLVAYPDMIVKHLPEDNPARRLVQRIGKTANEAADVIQDLLTLAGRGKYELRPTNLNDAISGYLISPSFIGLSEGHESVRVTTQLDESISKISGSPTHLMKIVMNLVVNAFQAMPNGGELSIGTSQKRLDRLNGGYEGIIPGKYVLLRIRDTGKGIRSDQLSRIFEPYYTTKEMGVGGSGLGLSVVYGIVKDHHGYYDVFSTAGDGTEFVLYFPVTELTERVPYVRDGKLDGTETILVVDDNEEQRELATICLASLGYSVESVCGGREAIEFLSKKEVDLVVLDMIMEEGFDGLDTFLELRKLRPEQKFVIASGYSETERVQRMQELGAGAYIRKPYALETLGEAIREELDKKPNRLAGSTGQIHT